MEEAIEIFKRKPQLNEDPGKAKIFPMFKDIVKKEQEERKKQKESNERPVTGKVIRNRNKQREQVLADSELDETIPYMGEETGSESGDIDLTVERVGQEEKRENHETENNENHVVMADWDDDLYSDEMKPTKKRQRFSNAPAIQDEIMELYRKGGESTQPEPQRRHQKCKEHVIDESNTMKVQTDVCEDKNIKEIGEIRRS